MKHYGDICNLNGAELPVVDCIVGGSPCQDLSVAGARAGLEGERSSLFMEQIRVVKEMREHDRAIGRSDEYVRPRYMVWENVPGAFSSGSPKGADFQRVLTEIIRIAEPKAPDVPLPNKGKWPYSGCICDELGGWSVAWRVHDAQYWGVPQRRKRVSVLADFNGLTASEILFDPKLLRETKGSESDTPVERPGEFAGREVQPQSEGLSRDSEPSGEKGEGATASASGSVGSTGKTALSFQERGGKPGGGKGILVQDEHTGAISTQNIQRVVSLEGNGSRESHRGDGFKESETMYTLNTVETHGVAYSSFIDTSHADSVVRMGEVASPLQNRDTKGGKLVLNEVHNT